MLLKGIKTEITELYQEKKTEDYFHDLKEDTSSQSGLTKHQEYLLKKDLYLDTSWQNFKVPPKKRKS